MPEVARCPVCGKHPGTDFRTGKPFCCKYRADDSNDWNRYVAAVHTSDYDELCERVAWMLECEDYLLILDTTNRWLAMSAYQELRHIVNAARDAVEEML